MSAGWWSAVATLCFLVAIAATNRDLSALTLGAGLALAFRSVVDADVSLD